MRFPSVFVSLLTSALLGLRTVVTADGLNLVLLHTNDMHSRFDETNVNGNECGETDTAQNMCYGGFARIAEAVRVEKENANKKGWESLYMVAGDIFQGTPYFSIFKTLPCTDFVNELKPDIMTLGNHEFDDGVSNLISYLQKLQNIPIVVSNLDMSAVPELNSIVLKSHVFTLNNTKVGVVGYLTPDTKTISDTGGVQIKDEIQCLTMEVKQLRDQGINIIIGLGHSGIETDKLIARKVEDIDIIVGGHSHTFLFTGEKPSIEKPCDTYPVIVINESNNRKIPIVQAYSNTKYIGKIDLEFDSNGELLNFKGMPILMDYKINKNLSMLKVLQKWKSKLSTYITRIIGSTAVELSNTCTQMECNIGNVITDSFVFYNVSKQDKICEHCWTDAPIALIQSGAIRTSINAEKNNGKITMGELINVIPFTKKLIKITITGETLLKAFEHSVSNYLKDTGTHRFLQVSGIHVVYDLSQNPNERVVSLMVRCGNCSTPILEPLVLSANYTILTNVYLAYGGNDYKVFLNVVKKSEIIDVDDITVIAKYIETISPIITGTEKRINFTN